MYCKILVVQNEKSEQELTTVTIRNLDCEKYEKVVSKLMTNFGKVSSEPEEILFGEDGLEILIGTYKVDVKLTKRPPNHSGSLWP